MVLQSCGGAQKPAAPLSVEASWDEVLERAEGQTVYLNAWGGDPRINAYLRWAGEELSERQGVTLRHVKLNDTAEAVSRILSEEAAGRTEGGTVDLLWINGENFAALKEAGLLYGPFAERLPSAEAIDFEGDATLRTDFAVPTEGYEAPWGRSYLTFAADRAVAAKPPASPDELLSWAEENEGRFTYPAPPDFTGTTFLKQIVLSDDELKPLLNEQPTEESFGVVWEKLSSYLDELHPHLWRGGRDFPSSAPAQRQLLADGEVFVTMAFNPTDAASAVARGQLPETVEAYTFESGTLGNAHFLAIPSNAAHKAGALAVVNFLLSEEAQARKADPEVWGDSPVLALTGAEAPPVPAIMLAEPHPQWTERLEAAWQERYRR
ncbi:ABC transporter substrate-binding protein [Parvularcula sp. BGMRC 0090]|uniref:ABC transporter substrate-binding protein n=1 Tax=Parvularcula maris TaxID=2965077 RepID=A0A9X2L7X3_9PROT|nr:ABC transporter substrate-binding protein [Parvularcula maris]